MNNMFPVNVTGYATDSSNIGDCRIFQIDFGGFTHALFNMDFLTKYTRNVGLGNLHYVASCRSKEKLDIGIYVNTTECEGDQLTALDIEKHGGINRYPDGFKMEIAHPSFNHPIKAIFDLNGTEFNCNNYMNQKFNKSAAFNFTVTIGIFGGIMGIIFISLIIFFYYGFKRKKKSFNKPETHGQLVTNSPNTRGTIV